MSIFAFLSILSAACVPFFLAFSDNKMTIVCAIFSAVCFLLYLLTYYIYLNIN